MGSVLSHTPPSFQQLASETSGTVLWQLCRRHGGIPPLRLCRQGRREGTATTTANYNGAPSIFFRRGAKTTRSLSPRLRFALFQPGRTTFGHFFFFSSPRPSASSVLLQGGGWAVTGAEAGGGGRGSCQIPGSPFCISCFLCSSHRASRCWERFSAAYQRAETRLHLRSNVFPRRHVLSP